MADYKSLSELLKEKRKSLTRKERLLRLFRRIGKIPGHIYYFLVHRLIHKYHTVPTGLEPGYHDVPERMFGACFELLVNFVEKEKPFEIICWGDCTPKDGKEPVCCGKDSGSNKEDNERHAKIKSDIIELYDWYLVHRSDCYFGVPVELADLRQAKLEKLVSLRPYLWT